VQVLAVVLLGLGFGGGAAGSTSSPPKLSGPPTPAAATRAFGRWLHVRHGDIHGWWSCPVEQLYGDAIDCLGEFRVGTTHHSTFARASLSHGRIVFSKVSDASWVRRWTKFSGRFLRRGGVKVVPGLASENGPAFDWGWLALGVEANWKRHRPFHLYALDGPGGWPKRFFDFTCTVRNTLVTCTNSFGDSMRYLPEGWPAAIVFARDYAGILEMSANGTNLRRLTTKLDVSPRWSPDHGWVAFSRADDSRPKASSEIWLIRSDRTDAHRLTSMYPGQAWGPTWSPDGRRVAFVAEPGGATKTGIWVVNIDGSGTSRITDKTNDNEPAWSPDGRHIAFVRGGSQSLYVADSSGGNAHAVLKKLPATFGGCQQASPSWSPDSKSIAFTCTERGAIWIVNADGTKPRRLITGSSPDWAAKGRWIAFASGSPASIYKIRPDRTQLSRLTHNPAGDDSPDW
jgi:hypothetical protein